MTTTERAAGIAQIVQTAIDNWRLANDPASDDGPTMAEHVAACLLDIGVVFAGAEGPEILDEVARLRTALAKLNRLRSNVIATQSASWSNALYPMVAILDEAGCKVMGATEDQKTEHLRCYGGAGGMPTLMDAPPYTTPTTVGTRLDGVVTT